MSERFLSSDEYDENAHQLYNEGRYDEALGILREGLSLYPNNVDLLVGLAYAHLAREEFAWARHGFERAASLDPDHEDALAGLGEVLLKFGQREQALAAFDRILELGFKDDHELMLQVGRALFRESLLAHAHRFFEYAIQAQPESAVVAAREATRLAQRHPGTLAVLARAEAEAGRPNVARGLLLEMERAAAFAYVPPTLVAIVHLGLGDREEAMAAFSRAIDERDWFIAELAVHPLADAARDDPRMPALLQRLGLEDVPRPR